MTQSRVSILIVTYQSLGEIELCVEAAALTGAELLVIDNGSADGTAELAKRLKVRTIANQQNRGFSAAVNQGVRATSSPLILLLNPDCVVQSSVEPLVSACEQAGVAIAGGQLISPSGVAQKGFNVRRLPSPVTLFCEAVLLNRAWPSNPVNWRYRCLDVDLAQPAEVEQPAGAFLMFRRDVWEKINGFDEGFMPVWFEDVDFCKRVRDAGFRVLYCPAALAEHTGGHSIHKIGLGQRNEYWYRSLLRYSIRHFHSAGRVLTCLGVIAGCLLRMLAGGSQYRRCAMLRSYAAVLRLAFRALWMRKVRFNEILS